MSYVLFEGINQSFIYKKFGKECGSRKKLCPNFGFNFGPGQVIHSIFVMSVSNECLLKLKKCLGPNDYCFKLLRRTNKVTLSRQMYFYKANVRRLVYLLICSLLCLNFFVYCVHSSENLQIYMETPSICFVTIPHLPNANSNKQNVGSLQVYFN